MARYKIEFKQSAAKEVKKLPAQVAKRVIYIIGTLAENPRPATARKLTGHELYRIRVGSYRIVYAIEEDQLVIYIVKVAHRRSVYRLNRK